MGNDVIDLTDPENVGKSCDRRFCRRVFNNDELALISASSQPDTILWAIWAAKEAAYKVVSRIDNSVCSIPKKYPVALEAAASPMDAAVFLGGIVVSPLGEVFVRISAENGMLHAVAAETRETLARVIARVKTAQAHELDDDLSELARKILREEIARRLDCPFEELAVLKEKERPWAPYMVLRNIRLPVHVSLSHDGRFAAAAFDPLPHS